MASSDEYPKVKARETDARHTIRRWEDKLVLLLASGLIALIVFMWQGLTAQITELERAKNASDVRVTVVEGKLIGLQAGIKRIEDSQEKQGDKIDLILQRLK